MKYQKVLASCTGKVGYETKLAALERVKGQANRKRAKKTGAWGKRKFQIYRCRNCHLWHVGGTQEIIKKRERGSVFDDIASIIPDAIMAKLGRMG